MKPVVLVSTDEIAYGIYRWSATPKTYVEALIDGADAVPLLLPSFGSAIDIDRALDIADGVFITGARSNLHPAAYGGRPSAESEPYDEARDATTLPLIRRTIARGVPLLAVCRGMQELNVALGGTLAGEIQALPGRLDHRGADTDDLDRRFRIAHPVTVEAGGVLADVLGPGAVDVNSVHRQAVDQLADGLVVEALAADGTIEAVRVREAPGFAVGVQWHPEYWARTDKPSRAIFQAFGTAMRDQAGNRRAAGDPAVAR